MLSLNGSPSDPASMNKDDISHNLNLGSGSRLDYIVLIRFDDDDKEL